MPLLAIAPLVPDSSSTETSARPQRPRGSAFEPDTETRLSPRFRPGIAPPVGVRIADGASVAHGTFGVPVPTIWIGGEIDRREKTIAVYEALLVRLRAEREASRKHRLKDRAPRPRG